MKEKTNNTTDKNPKINSEAFNTLRSIKIRQNIIAFFLLVSLGLNFNLFQQIKGDNNAATITEEYMNQAEEHMYQAEEHMNQAEEYMDQAEEHMDQAKKYMYQAEEYMDQAEEYMYQAEMYSR